MNPDPLAVHLLCLDIDALYSAWRLIHTRLRPIEAAYEGFEDIEQLVTLARAFEIRLCELQASANKVEGITNE